jgi:hypothetical protein
MIHLLSNFTTMPDLPLGRISIGAHSADLRIGRSSHQEIETVELRLIKTPKLFRNTPCPE